MGSDLLECTLDVTGLWRYSHHILVYSDSCDSVPISFSLENVVIKRQFHAHKVTISPLVRQLDKGIMCHG